MSDNTNQGPRWKVRFPTTRTSRRAKAMLLQSVMAPTIPAPAPLGWTGLFNAIYQHVTADQAAGIVEHLELVEELYYSPQAKGRPPTAPAG